MPAPPEPTSVDSLTGRSVSSRTLTAGARLRRAAAISVESERRAALVTLLKQPILPASGATADAYRLVWRHQEYLQDWLKRFPGWTLVLQSDVARLRKEPAGFEDCTRGAADPCNHQPLTRQRYALLCIVLAVLESEERQTTLGLLAERTSRLAAGDPRLLAHGFRFELTQQESRRDLVCAIHVLVDLGVMVRNDGDEQLFIHGTGDALYRIQRPILSSLLCVSRAPSTLPDMVWPDRLAALHEREFPDTDEARNRQLRHQLVRRLLDQPVIYYAQLSEQELAYLSSQRSHLLKEIEEATGLIAEVRGEGIALLDFAQEFDDIVLPEAGTLGHATLLLSEWLALQLRSGSAEGIELALIGKQMALLAAEHETHWKKGVTQPAHCEKLTREVLWRLEALGLIELRRGLVFPRPAIARYALRVAE